MRLPVSSLALYIAVVGCLASGALALGWHLVAKRTSPRILGRHLYLVVAMVDLSRAHPFSFPQMISRFLLISQSVSKSALLVYASCLV